MITEQTVRALGDAKLQDDQEQIQLELDRIAGEDFPSEQDLRFRDDLHRALGLCNAELRRRGLMVEAPGPASIVVLTDRPHRFQVGDVLAHADAPQDELTVSELTWRVRDGVAYPTYTLTGMYVNGDMRLEEAVDNVLDTADLLPLRVAE